MQEKNQPPENEDFLKDLPLTAEEVGFKPGEMPACGKCGRHNAPTRIKCLYCGAELEISAENAGKIKPVLRKLELWENGFNLIYLPDDREIGAASLAPVAKLTGHDAEAVRKILEARKPLPLLRCETAKEAEILQNRLRDEAVRTRIVADEKLDPENLPKRLRAMEFRDDGILLILFNNDEVEKISAADLALIVTGAIFQKAVEATEARKKGESKILEASETASDESLFDLYTAKNAMGYRVLTKGFDFSCLGAEKGILARENIKKLAAKLQSLAPHARADDDYLSVRSLLGEVWEIEQRRDSQGLTRQRFGKFDLSSVSSSTNLQQFTKYSRLQWYLL